MTNKKPLTILSNNLYHTVVNFIQNYEGLAIDCNIELEKKFHWIHRQTLKSILSTEMGTRTKVGHSSYKARAATWLNDYLEDVEIKHNKNILLNTAIAENVSPVILCRVILQVRNRRMQKGEITRILRDPDSLNDDLAANVKQCLASDNQEGPLEDLRCRCLGVEYEFKLKQLATEAQMAYFDEEDLRRIGFDKTPDLKLVLPCLYKGCVVNWIESKALFGDIRTHKRYLHTQLISYYNRFGPGIVIYWFGYQEEVARAKDNGTGLIILADFPKIEDLEFLTT